MDTAQSIAIVVGTLIVLWLFLQAVAGYEDTVQYFALHFACYCLSVVLFIESG